jgi:hypothetical protein
VRRVCSIVKQVASALDAAHQLGMVHRDIKPENIVLVQATGGEQAKVLDFGIAKMREAGAGQLGSGTLTQTGVIIGSPPYMSPEQAVGMRGDQLDGRSDLYSLGVVMYQMLTGALPLKADTTMSMLMAHIQTPPVPIHEASPGLLLPDSIASLVMRMLEKKRESRPSSAQTVIEVIEEAGEETAALPGATIVGPPNAARASEAVKRAATPPVGAPRVPARETWGAAAPPQLGATVKTPSAPLGTASPPPGTDSGVTPAKSFRWGRWLVAGVLVILLAGLVWGFSAYRRNQEFETSHEQGHELMKKEDWDGAIREYREALKLRPDLDHVRLDLALALQAKGQRRKAFEEFEVVCTRSPNLPECRQNYQDLMKQLKVQEPRP